ncbi:hypothetical protein D3C87_1343740 [compost metagenome]
MKKWLVWGLGAMMAFSLTGCGVSGSLVTPEGQAEASGLLAPKLPTNRLLSTEERQGDFDRFLAMATREALAWSPKALLMTAQATDVDARGKAATYVYTFTSGRHALSVTISGNAVTFAKIKADLPLGNWKLIPAAQAMEAALKTGKLGGERFTIYLGGSPIAPIYVIREFTKEWSVTVRVNAHSGELL